MGVFSSIMMLSFFFSILTPFAVGLSSTLYGRAMGFVATTVGTILTVFLLSLQTEATQTGELVIYNFAFMYILCAGLGLILAELVRMKVNPVKGILSLVSGLLILFLGALIIYNSSAKTSISEELVTSFESQKAEMMKLIDKVESQGGSVPVEYKELVNNPEQFPKLVLERGVVRAVAGIVVFVWFNLFFLLKIYRLIGRGSHSNLNEYSELNLLNLKVPESFIWGLIVTFGIQLAREYYPVPDTLFLVSSIILGIMGAFYFFQGLSIYLAFLDHIKLKGFFRSFLVIITIFYAPVWALPLLALIDVFFDLKRFYKKQN